MRPTLCKRLPPRFLGCHFYMFHSLIPHVSKQGAINTYPFLFEKRDFFPPFWPNVHTYPLKTDTENVPFQNCSPEWRFLNTPIRCTRVDRSKRRFLKTITSRRGVQSIPRTRLGANISWAHQQHRALFA